MKKTKKGDAIVDVRPLIKSASAEYSDGLICITATLSPDQSCFLNPEHLITAMKEKSFILNDPCLINEYYSIMRMEAFTENMKEFF